MCVEVFLEIPKDRMTGDLKIDVKRETDTREGGFDKIDGIRYKCGINDSLYLAGKRSVWGSKSVDERSENGFV